MDFFYKLVENIKKKTHIFNAESDLYNYQKAIDHIFTSIKKKYNKNKHLFEKSQYLEQRNEIIHTIKNSKAIFIEFKKIWDLLSKSENPTPLTVDEIRKNIEELKNKLIKFKEFVGKIEDKLKDSRFLKKEISNLKKEFNRLVEDIKNILSNRYKNSEFIKKMIENEIIELHSLIIIEEDIGEKVAA